MVLAAQESHDSRPPELVRLREEQLTELQRVQIPVLTKYIQELNVLKDQYTRESRSAALVSTDAEIKSAQTQLDIATKITNKTSLLPLELTIISAVYGNSESHNNINITAEMRAALGSGKKTFQLTDEILAGRPEPAPGKRKSLIVDYAINGEKKHKSFEKATSLDFEQLQ